MLKYENNLEAKLNGNNLQPLSGVTVTVTDITTGLTASLYSDNGVTPINTAIVTDDNGYFSFYAPDGIYTLTFTSPRIATITRQIALEDPRDNPYASKAELAAGTGSALVTFTQSGAGAVPMSVAEAIGEAASVSQFMTAAQRNDAYLLLATLDLAPAIQTAIDSVKGKLRLPPGRYRLNSQIIVRNKCTGLIGAGMYDTVFDKQFDGEAISVLTNGAVSYGFGIVGNSATRSGGGILPEGYNIEIGNLRITDTRDCPIIVKAAIGSNANAATYLDVHDCFLQPGNALTTYAVRSIGADDAGRPTCRNFARISGGSSLVDFSGMNYATLSDSLGTTVKFSSGSSKIHMSNNRLTCQDDITIYGNDHVISSNSWGFGTGKALYLDASSANVTFDAANAISINGIFGQAIKLASATGAANPNFIHSESFSYPFGWYATTTNPVLGNAITKAYCKLSGSMCFVSMSMTTGSTTSVGTGTYTFQLPYKALYTATGMMLIRTAAGNYYESSFIVQAGGSVGIVILSDAATAAWGSSTLSFGTGSTIDMSINYQVSPS